MDHLWQHDAAALPLESFVNDNSRSEPVRGLHARPLGGRGPLRSLYLLIARSMGEFIEGRLSLCE